MKDRNFLVSNGINIEASLEIFGTIEEYNETLNDFLASAREKLSNIEKYKTNGDMANYAILVHSFKSDAKYLGFTKLAELSYLHEINSKENNINYVYDNFDSLLEEANRIISVVDVYLGKDALENTITIPKITPFYSKGKAILCVDDSNLITNLLVKMFDTEFDVIVANDGSKALDIINGHDSNKVYGMFLDLNMPNVNGYAVLDYMLQNNLFSKIPVAIVTGDDSRETINKALTYPVIDILTKPFNEKNIKFVMSKMCEQRNS